VLWAVTIPSKSELRSVILLRIFKDFEIFNEYNSNVAYGLKKKRSTSAFLVVYVARCGM
jgi:hypothetical protein